MTSQFSPKSIEIILLNKITTHSWRLHLPIGQLTTFQNISILPHVCTIQPTDQVYKSYTALVDAWVIQDGKDSKGEPYKPILIISDWMNSGQSSLQHPVYEIQLVRCF